MIFLYAYYHEEKYQMKLHLFNIFHILMMYLSLSKYCLFYQYIYYLLFYSNIFNQLNQMKYVIHPINQLYFYQYKLQ